MFQCSTMSGSNFMEGGGPPPVLQRDKKPSAYRVKIVPKLFLCAYIKSCFCPVFRCLKSVIKECMAEQAFCEYLFDHES